MTPASAAEEEAILAVLPPPMSTSRDRGAVLSLLVEHAGMWLDGAVVVGPPHEVFVRPLPQHDRAGLDTWIGILDRRRAQLVHDLSGPATGVLAAVETVLEYEPIPESTRSLLGEARVGILRLSELLAERHRSSIGTPNMLAGPLASLLERAASRVVRGIDPLGRRLHLEVDAPEDEVRMDVALLEGALSTLLSNAWKARLGVQAVVRIGAESHGELVRLTVRDEGRGLEPEALRRAGELGFSTWPSGAGLSLFLLRRAVSRHGGAIAMESRPRGARVSVVLRAG